MNHIICLEYEEFRHRFLGSPIRTSRNKRRPRSALNALKNAEAMSADDLSDVFIKVVNTHKLIPGSTMSSHRCDVETTSEDATHKVDVAVFPHARRGKPEDFSWADQTMPAVFVRSASGADPFDVTEPDYDDEVKDVQALSLQRISTIVELLFTAQHRTAVLMIFVIGRKFRLVRWDRAGIIVTPAIDYYDDQATLCESLGHISRLDAVALGFDPTATRIYPGTAEFSRMDSAARQHPKDMDHTERNLKEAEVEGPFVFEYARSLFGASLITDWPRHLLQVPSGAATRHYLVGKPAFIAYGVVGRGTRGYVALDCETGRFVWLKDVWRMSYMATDREGDVLQRLNLAGVEGVPTLVCHGDVLEQVTVTSGWSCAPSRGPVSVSPGHSEALCEDDSCDATMRGPLRQHTHYRIAVDEVCLPLGNFTNGKQLVSLVLDTLRTHHQVATNPQTRLLHCDISSGNVMIYPKIKRDGTSGHTSLIWTGILSDWELSKSVDDQKAFPKATQAHRLGTYQFMSVNLLQEPSRPVQVSDELESFFHVLVYYAVRHLRSTCERPSTWITDYFYCYAGPQQLKACGLKSAAIETDGRLEIPSPPGPLLFFSPLDYLLFYALQCFNAHYKVMDYERRQASASRPTLPPPKASKAPMTAAQKRLLQIDYDIDEAVVAQLDAEHAARSLIKRGPTAEERELAAQLADHTFMLAHLEKFLRDPGWSDNDRIAHPAPSSSSSRANPQRGADLQLNSASKSIADPKATEKAKRPRPAEPSNDRERPVKRQRTSQPKPARKAPTPTPALPSTHAMRTRSQARRERGVLGAPPR